VPAILKCSFRIELEIQVHTKNSLAARASLASVLALNPAKQFSERHHHGTISGENVFGKKPSLPSSVEILAGIIAQFLEYLSECWECRSANQSRKCEARD
jgi:hypothetical protein